MNELNKKLVEWAKCEGEYDRVFEKPFTQSLDACFKWLVPKIVRMGGWISCGIDENEAFALVDAENDDFYELFDGKHFEGEAITPALALCLAVEKLIDSEKENGEDRT